MFHAPSKIDKNTFSIECINSKKISAQGGVIKNLRKFYSAPLNSINPLILIQCNYYRNSKNCHITTSHYYCLKSSILSSFSSPTVHKMKSIVEIIVLAPTSPWATVMVSFIFRRSNIHTTFPFQISSFQKRQSDILRGGKPVGISMALSAIYSFSIWNGIAPLVVQGLFIWTKKWTPASAEESTVLYSLKFTTSNGHLLLVVNQIHEK